MYFFSVLFVLFSFSIYALPPIGTYKGYDNKGRDCSVEIVSIDEDKNGGEDENGIIVKAKVNYSKIKFKLSWPITLDKDNYIRFNKQKLQASYGDDIQSQSVRLYLDNSGNPKYFKYNSNQGLIRFLRHQKRYCSDLVLINR